jgi:hypothetical protein
MFNIKGVRTPSLIQHCEGDPSMSISRRNRSRTGETKEITVNKEKFYASIPGLLILASICFALTPKSSATVRLIWERVKQKPSGAN